MTIDLEMLTEIAQIFNNLVVGLGIIAGGIWGYYRYVKGRLFSPQVEINLSDFVVKQTINSMIASVEVHIKNTGPIRIEPSICMLSVVGIEADKSELKEEDVHSSGNLVDEPIIQPGTWFFEPQQSDWFSMAFTIPKSYDLLRVTCVLIYNRKKSCTRHFYVDPITDKLKSSQTKNATSKKVEKGLRS